MGRTLQRLLFAVTLIGLAGATASAQGLHPEPVNVAEFKPTQAELGRSTVREMVSGWKADAKSKGMSLASYTQKVLKPQYEARPVTAVIDPQGAIRATDGHHTMAALQAVQTESGVRINRRVQVLKNYRGYTQRKFAADLVATGSIRGSTASLRRSPTAQLKSIPDSFAKMADNPMRSVVGRIFNRTGISGRVMSNYIEFKVADKLLQGGILKQLKSEGLVAKSARKVPAKAADNARIERVVEQHILGNPQMVKFLVANARSSSVRGEAVKNINKAVKDHKATRAVAKPKVANKSAVKVAGKSAVKVANKSAVKSATAARSGFFRRAPSKRSSVAKRATRSTGLAKGPRRFVVSMKRRLAAKSRARTRKGPAALGRGGRAKVRKAARARGKAKVKVKGR